jgi:hypothetical protein
MAMNESTWNRRGVLRAAALGITGVGLGRALTPGPARAQQPGERPPRPGGVSVLDPRGRVPVSLIIDDSTCLVNLAHFAIPQFAEVFPDQYRQDWHALPREIPDRFVARFAEWCAAHHVKGKYSIVPYPACVGWLDRDLPGWSRRDLEASLELVRRAIVPDWDIHPEMISHTWAVDTKTGRPYPTRSEKFMENWGFSQDKSADELAEYLAYALRILRNVGLRCEGVTTPGGFGNQNRENLARATLDSVRDVFAAEVPHYFRHLFTGSESVAPRVEFATGLDGDDPRCVVSIIGCTGDWFGGWDGLEAGSVDRFITEDGRGGRLPEVIARGEPAVMVGHWPGFYFNGEEVGFRILQGIVARLEAHYDHLIWMRLSDLARYWAARELTRIVPARGALNRRLAFHAPFACPAFTIRIDEVPPMPAQPSVRAGDEPEGTEAAPLREVRRLLDLEPGTWTRDGRGLVACLDLPRGHSVLDFS